MNEKKIKWISKIAISTGSLIAVITPVITTVAYQSKTTISSEISVTENNEAASKTAIYNESGVPSHFELSLGGFKSIYQSLEKLYPGIKVDYTKLESNYNANPVKANYFIAYVNTTLMHRGFWSNLWDGIKHVATTIGNGIVDAANIVVSAIETLGTAIAAGVTFGQVPILNQAVVDSANRTIEAATSFFNDAAGLIKTVTGLDIKNFTNTDWAKFGATIFMFACPEAKLAIDAVAGFVTRMGASAIESSVTKLVIGSIIKNTIADYLNWPKNRMQLEIQLSDVKKYDILASIRESLTTGVNYYNDGTTAYKITVI